ncbi:unnamed protein product [Haemonchus placei]|uniref:MARVEL domain-containing protein n=1 Tax=Haemonchus placei TaxID=6290 RepID=A0A0N4X225_HAEPC|nr:unnamed protein product [Haemonchus placei]
MTDAALADSVSVVGDALPQESDGCGQQFPIAFLKTERVSWTLIYGILATTLVTHLAVSIFLLVFSLWYAFIPLAITLLAHAVGFLAIRRHSYLLFTIFMVYEGLFILALLALDVWLLIVMEIKPSLSFFGKKCLDSSHESGACEGEIRKSAAIAGAAVSAIILQNVLVLWSGIRNFFHYLRATPRTRTATVRAPVAGAAQEVLRAVPSAPNASDSMRRAVQPQNPATDSRTQLYTIYSPTAHQPQPTEFVSPDVPGPSTRLYPGQEIVKVNPNEEVFGSPTGAFRQFEPPPPYM